MAKANSPFENVRALQRVLYVAAKRNRERKFHALLDRIARSDVLWCAWEQVRRNRGAAGVDGETLKAVQAYGVERMLTELSGLLLAGRYRPQPSRRVLIPKPGRPGEERPLSIPRVRDRVAQTAAKLVLEPHLRGQLPADVVRLPTQAQRARRAGADQEGGQPGGAVGGGPGLQGLLGDIATLPPGLLESVEEAQEGAFRGFREFDAEALAPSRPEVHGAQLAALYTLQHRLP
jgi:hypothetical protein